MPDYVTIIADAMAEPGVLVARHTHPGIETTYVLEGTLELGADRKATPYAGGKASDKKIKLASIYVVEEGKLLASPA
jgi:hypothetical protein